MAEVIAGSEPSRRGRYLFEDFEFDLDRGRLVRGSKEIPLRPKSFAVLQYLIEHAGQLVTRDELLAAVWPEVVVTDDSIAQCLIELRRAVGDDQHSKIRTIPRRGVIFEIPVRFENLADHPTPQRSQRLNPRRWTLAAGLVVIAALLVWWADSRRTGLSPERAVSAGPVSNSIAVLRFTDMSPEGDQAYLADGFSEEILHVLAQSPSLRVVARASSFAVSGQSIEAIAGQLGVTHVLEGSVRRHGDEIRVTAQLIDAATSIHIWSRTYDRDLNHLFEVQREIANAVAASLEVSLADGDAPSSIDPRAYQLFLEGSYFYNRRAEGDLEQAQQRFQEALEISPEFARAWTGMAAIISIQVLKLLEFDPAATEREQLLEAFRDATQQALRYGPKLPEAHIRAARYYSLVGDKEKALQHVEIARTIDPDHWLVRTTLGNELRAAGRINESISLFQRESQRDPLNMVLRENVVGHLLWAQRYEDARVELDRIGQLAPAEVLNSRILKYHRTRLHILSGEFEAAVTSANSIDDEMGRLQMLAMAYFGLGRQSAADDALERFIARVQSDSHAFAAAEIRAHRGEVVQSMTWLDRIDLGTGCEKVRLVEFVYYSPFLANLNGTPAWEQRQSRLFEVMKACRLGLEIDPP